MRCTGPPRMNTDPALRTQDHGEVLRWRDAAACHGLHPTAATLSIRSDR